MAANTTIFLSIQDRSTSGSEYSLRAIRASDGALLWCNTSPIETEVTQIIAAYDTLYVLSISQSLLEVNSVEAWKTGNGALLWRTRVEGAGSGPLVLEQESIYVSCFAPHGLYALRVSDGNPLWHCPFEQDVTHCTVSNGIVYVALSPETPADGQGALVALRADDGSALWSRLIDHEVRALTVNDEYVYIDLAGKTCRGVPHALSASHTGDGALLLRASDGTTLWQNDPDSTIITMAIGMATATDRQEQPVAERPSPKEMNLFLTEANKALVHRFFEEVLSKGNVTVTDELLDANYISSRDEYLPGLPSGLKGFKDLMSRFHTAFPDGHFDPLTVQSHYAQEDLVVANYQWHGINTGDLPGHPPTGEPFTFTGRSVLRIAHGKIVQSWCSFDSFAADLIALLAGRNALRPLAQIA